MRGTQSIRQEENKYDITLEMLEEVAERTGASFEEAKAALQANDGSVKRRQLVEEEKEESKSFEKAVKDTIQFVKDMAEKVFSAA